ncbi:MAG: class E sortase [Actinomycetota bacterium]|nr:class E sortase [Actinomycetota bacterium]
MDKLIGFLRQNRWARRALTGFSALLLVVAIVLLAYPAYTNWVHNRLQGNLRSQLTSPSLKDAYVNHRLKDGDSLTRIQIPKIGVDVVVVEGISESALKADAGHYPTTPLPCTAGNVAIAGHRTTYGKPFANVDQLGPGDKITLTTPVGSCTYQLAAPPTVVSPNDVSVIANVSNQSVLTLTTCTPKGSASHRLIVRAVMLPDNSTKAA